MVACFVPAPPVLVEVGLAVPVLVAPALELAPAALVDDPGAKVEVTTADVADKEAVAVPSSTVM